MAKPRDSSGNALSSLGSPSINWNGGSGGNGAYYNSNLVNQMFTNMDSLIWRLGKCSEATTENFLLFRRQEEQFLPGSFQQMVWNRLAT